MLSPFVSLLTPRTIPSVKFKGADHYSAHKIRLNTAELSAEALETRLQTRIEKYRKKGADLFEQSEAETDPNLSYRALMKARRKFTEGRRLSIVQAQSTGPS